MKSVNFGKWSKGMTKYPPVDLRSHGSEVGTKTLWWQVNLSSRQYHRDNGCSAEEEQSEGKIQKSLTHCLEDVEGNSLVITARSKRNRIESSVIAAELCTVRRTKCSSFVKFVKVARTLSTESGSVVNEDA